MTGTPELHDNPDEARYELRVDGELAGWSTYKITGEVISLLHTETLPEFAGRGLARVLVEEVLADVRRRGLAVLPFCPYVLQVIGEHPDRYLDLVPPSQRPRFELPAA